MGFMRWSGAGGVACDGKRRMDSHFRWAHLLVLRVSLRRRDPLTSQLAFGRRRAAQPARGSRSAMTVLFLRDFIGKHPCHVGADTHAHHWRKRRKSCQGPIPQGHPARPGLTSSSIQGIDMCLPARQRLSVCCRGRQTRDQGLSSFSPLFFLFFHMDVCSVLGRRCPPHSGLAEFTPVHLNSLPSATSDEPHTPLCDPRSRPEGGSTPGRPPLWPPTR